MFVCATAAFMKRRSRMAEVMAAVPTAAHAARRMKSRRVITEIFLLCIDLLLNDVIRRTDDQVNHGTHAIAHLGFRWRGAVREVGRIGYVPDDIGLHDRRDLAGGEQG